MLDDIDKIQLDDELFWVDPTERHDPGKLMVSEIDDHAEYKRLKRIYPDLTFEQFKNDTK
jgi:hypothetical protein